MRTWAVLSLLAALVGAAHAQPAGPDAGRAAFQAGDYKRAIDELNAANALAPSPLLDLALAQAHESLGHREQAAHHYMRFLEAAPAAPERQAVIDRLIALKGVQVNFVTGSSDRYAVTARGLTCTTPCTTFVAPGDLRLIIDGGSRFSREVEIPNVHSTTVELQRRSQGALIAGIVMGVVGTLALAAGISTLAVNSARSSTGGDTTAAGYVAIGFVIGGGAGASIGFSLVGSNASHKVKLLRSPPDAPPTESGGRAAPSVMDQWRGPSPRVSLVLFGDGTDAAKQQRCDAAVAALGIVLDPAAPLIANVAIDGERHMSILAAGQRIHAERLPSWSIERTCQFVSLRMVEILMAQRQQQAPPPSLADPGLAPVAP